MRRLGHFYHASRARVNVGSATITCVCNRLTYREGMRGTGPPGPLNRTVGTHPGGVTVKRALAAVVGVAFVFASAGLVAAQTPAPKPEDKKMEDKKDTSMKKAPH